MPIILCMTKTDLIPNLEKHLQNYKPKRYAGDGEEPEPGVDRELALIRSRAGGSKMGSQLGSRLGSRMGGRVV